MPLKIFASTYDYAQCLDLRLRTMPLKIISKKVSAESPVDPKKKLSHKADLLVYNCPNCNNFRSEQPQCGWCGYEYTPAAAQPEVHDAIKVEKPKGSEEEALEEKASNVSLEEKVNNDAQFESGAVKNAEKSSGLNSQGQVFDIEKPNSVAHMDKAKDKVVTHGCNVSSQDHPLQDESEEHGQDGGPPLKPEEHDLDGRDPLKTKTSMDEFKRSTSSGSTAKDHGGGPPRELEEPSLDGQSESRLNDTYTAYDWSYDDKISTYESYAVAYDKISTYTAHEESYDDKAAPCA